MQLQSIKGRGPLIRSCEWCGDTFRLYPSFTKNGRGRFCGNACRLASLHTANTKPFIGRFWAKVLKTDTCWLWQGALNATGYGNATRCR